jgi:protein-tyrosine kinase
MEHIRQAVELARGTKPTGVEQTLPRSVLPPQTLEPEHKRTAPDDANSKKAVLDLAHLEANRIIAHDRTDQRSRSFDMLRTQVLQSMDLKSWQFLAVTSPTSACGKTLTAINIALSIARQPESSVLLVDLDFEKPQVARCLGLQCKEGILSVLDGKSTLQNALIRANVGDHQLTVLPCEASTIHSSEYMTSRAMSSVLQEIKNEDRSRIVIFDMAPMLAGDNVISILPQMDCVLFVAAIGTTTASEIKECNKHLQTSAVIRVVLNKASELGPMYY